MDAPIITASNNNGMPTINENEENPGLSGSIGSHGSNASLNSVSYSGNGHRQSSSSSRHQELTVDKKWKVEDRISDKLSEIKNRPSRLIPLAKWLATIILGGSILTLFVATKLSFIALSRALSEVKPRKAINMENMEEWVHYTGQFLIIYLALSIPPIILLCRSFWMGLFTRQVPWPKVSSIFCCVLAGVLEPLGLILLSLKVLPIYPPTVGVLLTGTVVTIPVLVATVKSFAEGDTIVWNILHVVASFCVMAGCAGVALLLDMDELSSTGGWHNLAHILGAIVCLNIAWLPVLQNQMIKSSHIVDGISRRNLTSSVSTGFNTPDMSSSSGGNSYSAAGSSDTGFGGGGGVEPVPDQLVDDQANVPFLDRQVTVFKKATWKSCIILYSVKLISIFIICFIFFYVDSGYSMDTSFTPLMHEAFLKGWNFGESIQNHYTWPVFAINLGGGFLCYALVFIVCHTNMQPGGLGLPLLFSLPITILFTYVDQACVAVMNFSTFCSVGNNEVYYVIPATIVLTIGQIVAFGRHAFKKDKTYLQKEGEVFWIPGYQTAVIDSWLLLDRKHRKPKKIIEMELTSPKTRVYICTTMYREDESEMRQLLESLNRINMAQAEGNRFFESHIVFDGGVDKKNPSEFALVLISLLEETLGIKPAMCTKITTPYGLKLSWMLPTAPGKHHMTFNIHLKDNKLVKNKKRWSQVMYMSYVIDFLTEAAAPDEESYILTTDADVMFTPASVEALLDLMSRDNSIGAVCARTHPMGSGPLVWYQIFEYAVGHWFQKASEHVLGSVLCAPGCFSVYRCRSLQDILPKYSKKVESAFDFLTKDMGEDRWLCTLMVQSGWRIEYCAASENSTNCPSEFEEFYKQRRRWIASTLANLMLIIKEWRYIALFNQRVSIIFLIYQCLLLFSTLIGPSTIVLVVSGGLVYAWNFNSVVSVILQLVLCAMFAFVCIYCSPKTHLKVAKIYTFLYAMVMCAVVVGTAEQIVSDMERGSSSPSNSTTPAPQTPLLGGRYMQDISIDVPVSVTTIYFAFLALMFVLAGILHPRELPCLCHSLWYLLCLPSAYLVLMIYSICNLTDSSWGTREATTNQVVVKRESWYQYFKRGFYSLFFCCTPPDHFLRGEAENKEVQTVTSYLRHSSLSVNPPADVETNHPPRSASAMSIEDDARAVGMGFGDVGSFELSANFHSDLHLEPFHELDEIEAEDIPVPVEDWLPQEFRKKYTKVFNRHGFDSTLFIKGLTEKDLNRLGITTRGHVQFLMAQITQLPAFEIEYKVPIDVNDWLHEIGLPMYKDNFRRNHIRTAREMEILKRFDRKDIEKELGITKEGHIKRLLYAIRMLRDPTDGQQKAMRMRQAVEETPIHYLREFNVAEFEFWKNLRSKCLEPDLKAFGLEAEIKIKLVELRNNWLIVMAVSNFLWLILIITLASKSELTVLGANPLGLVFLFIFGLIFIIQLICMMIHRLSTLSHYLARAPYKFGKPLKTHWSFQDKNVNSFEDTEDVNNVRKIKHDAERALKRATMKTRKQSSNSTVNERSPLLVHENHNGAFLNHGQDYPVGNGGLSIISIPQQHE